MKMRSVVHWKPLVGAAVGAMLLSGCTETPEQMGQATTYKQGKYQGKTDARPYEAGPSAYSQENSWQAGDKGAWEKAIKTRQQAQNEYNRAE